MGGGRIRGGRHLGTRATPRVGGAKEAGDDRAGMRGTWARQGVGCSKGDNADAAAGRGALARPGV